MLEGLLTVLIGEKIEIIQLLESESNQAYSDEKFYRMDFQATNSQGENIIVKIQPSRQLHYYERIVLGEPQIIDIDSWKQRYRLIKKVYSINILYFDLGKGGDYLYHGTTRFVGVHTGDELQVSTKENNIIRMRTPAEIFPEYFIIRVNEFNQVATTPLEEWMEYLKNGHIPEHTSTPGLEEARKKLEYLAMSKQERAAYDEHLNAIMIQNDVLDTAKLEGRAEGMAKGMAKGMAEGMAKGRAEGERMKAISIARNLVKQGMDIATIASVTGLTPEEVRTCIAGGNAGS